MGIYQKKTSLFEQDNDIFLFFFDLIFCRSNEVKFFALQVLDDTLVNRPAALTIDDRVLLRKSLVQWMTEQAAASRATEPSCISLSCPLAPFVPLDSDMIGVSSRHS